MYVGTFKITRPATNDRKSTSMHLGFTPWFIDAEMNAKELCRQAELGEQWGYDSIFLPEHHFGQGTSIPEPLMLLAAVAARTRRLRLGTTSFLLPLRHPLHVSEQVAVLDQLSDGRVIFGVGRGYAPALFAAFGIEQAAKRAIFKESLENILAAWRGESVADEPGSAPISISPLPRQQPHPPIWVAAFGPLALKQAGSLGLPYLASPMETRSRLTENYEIQRSACDKVGKPHPVVVPIMRSVFISDQTSLVSKVRERLDRESRTMVRGADSANAPTTDDWAIVGDEHYARDLLTRYREELGVTHVVVTRLRIGGVPGKEIERSVATAAEIAAG